MFHRNHSRISQSVTEPRDRSTKCWTRSLLNVVSRTLYLMRPTLISLAFMAAGSAAHAQGTMDFSGADTLMQTFNVGSCRVQAQIIGQQLPQIVSKELMRTVEGERKEIRHLKHEAKCRMLLGSRQIRQQLPDPNLPPLIDQHLSLIRRLPPTVQVPDMNQDVLQLPAGDCAVHNLVRSSRVLGIGVAIKADKGRKRDYVALKVSVIFCE